MVKVGDSIVFVDSHGVDHDALVTAVHGEAREIQMYGSNEKIWWEPCINLVFVSTDENKTDPYGRQLERHTSVGHQSTSTAHGMFYKAK